MIKVCNLRHGMDAGACHVKIDRSSPLGNPFYMANESQRDKVCEEYEVWIGKQIAANDPKVINELNRLLTLARKYGKLILYCWCAPKRCHGETIKRLIESKL